MRFSSNWTTFYEKIGGKADVICNRSETNVRKISDTTILQFFALFYIFNSFMFIIFLIRKVMNIGFIIFRSFLRF